MTIQIGLLGNDGILLAGDTRCTNNPPLYEVHRGLRVGYNATKIISSHEQKIAIACARNLETARHIANEIISSSMTEEEWLSPILRIEEIGARVLAKADGRNDAHCLIAKMGAQPRLFLFMYATVNGEPGKPLCEEITTNAVAGDNMNAAIFWVDRYYEKKPIRSLIPMAAQFVVMAGKLNSGVINGLEMVLCDANGVHRLSAESIATLERQADEWDKKISELFSAYSQQFTYAQDVIR
ncbi:MAG TPA: hypothetical protein VG892_00300 [Terriglobales bacterium]|jgi:hypothetical protein|nr:hypothetical protein [Terriglobales bacterium]